MPEIDSAERKGDVTRIGLTLSIKLLQNVKHLYLSSCELLFPYEISFSDFVNLVLKASTYRIFPPLPYEEDEETIFYSLRIPSDLRNETIESLRETGQGTWKEVPPIDYNQFVKNQFLRCTTEEGQYSTLDFIKYIY